MAADFQKSRCFLNTGSEALITSKTKHKYDFEIIVASTKIMLCYFGKVSPLYTLAILGKQMTCFIALFWGQMY
jgi:hypothetical protein